MYIVTQLLITTLMTTPATDGVRDLCEVVHRKTGTPTICQPHKEGAPVYDANVCCSGSTCFAQSTRGCPDGEEPYYCGLGAQLSTGEVACYFEVQSYCDVHVCKLSVSPPTWEDTICCQWGTCTAVALNAPECPVGDLYYCSSLVSNGDGTVSCVEWEG